jgi:transcriptional regulator with XRE-family HTH domain
MARPRHAAASARKRRHTAGERLRSRRLSLGLTLRDVQRFSIQLSRRLHNSKFALPASRLHDFETKDTVPGVHRMYVLAKIYACNLRELLAWYGIPQK